VVYKQRIVFDAAMGSIPINRNSMTVWIPPALPSQSDSAGELVEKARRENNQLIRTLFPRFH